MRCRYRCCCSVTSRVSAGGGGTYRSRCSAGGAGQRGTLWRSAVWDRAGQCLAVRGGVGRGGAAQDAAVQCSVERGGAVCGGRGRGGAGREGKGREGKGRGRKGKAGWSRAGRVGALGAKVNTVQTSLIVHILANAPLPGQWMVQGMTYMKPAHPGLQTIMATSLPGHPDNTCLRVPLQLNEPPYTPTKCGLQLCTGKAGSVPPNQNIKERTPASPPNKVVEGESIKAKGTGTGKRTPVMTV